MDYNKLYTFTKVAEAGGISQAARLLRRTQSAITQQIQGLEADLGYKLFERRQARLFLSPQGQALYETAAAALSLVDDKVSESQADALRLQGRLRIAALSDQSTEYDVVGEVCRFREAHPEVDLHLAFTSNEHIEQHLLAGAVDFGISIRYTKPQSFVQSEICSAQHTLVASRNYLKRHDPLRTYRDILAADLIDFSDDFLCLEPWFRKNKSDLVPQLLHRRPNLVFTDHNASLRAVRADLGLSVLPRHLVKTDLERGSLVGVMPSSKDLRVGLDISYRRGRTLRFVERRFLEFISTGPVRR